MRILTALLVGAALAGAQDVREETVGDAVRFCLAEMPDDLAPGAGTVLDATAAQEPAAVDVVMRGIHEAVRRSLEPRGYLSAAADETTKPWEITGALGFTLTDGNSDTIQLTIGAEAKREWTKWKLGMKLGILYGETDGEQTSSEWIFLERLERKLSERATIFQDLLLEHDEEEDLRYRIQFTVGYNRRLVKKETFELWGQVGGGVLHEEFFDDTQTEGVAQIGINFTWQITKALKYEQVLTFYPSLSESGEFRMYWESRFTTPLGERFDLRISIIDRYDSDPQPGIEENDLTIAIALAIRFTKPPPAPPK
jgi:putative salt-induced outer membrane protein YdiY